MKTSFKNPVLESKKIKQFVLYTLDNESTRRLLNQERNEVMKNTARYSPLLDEYTETTDDFHRNESGESRGRRYRRSELLIHHYDSDVWANRMYTMFTEEAIPTWSEAFLEDLNKVTSERKKRGVRDYCERYGLLGQWDGIRTEVINENNILPRLKEMICFFSKFAPLSPLGYSILWRLNGENTRVPIITYGQSPFLSFKQENIYRCLLAINNGFLLDFPEEKKRIRVIDFVFRNNSLLEQVKDPFVLLEDSDGKQYWHEVPGDRLIYLVDKDYVQNSKTRRYSVKIRTCSETEDYILKKAEKIWKPEKITPNLKMSRHNMIYYPESELWKTYMYTYKIDKEGEEEFKNYIKSFGDFVERCDLQVTEKEKRDYKLSYSSEDFCFSLCTPYNSDHFFYRFRGKMHTGSIPAFTNMELYWLEFILIKYPNFCRMFLNTEEEYGEKEENRSSTYWIVLKEIQGRIRDVKDNYSSYKTYRNIFWKDRYFEISYFDQKVKDLASLNVAKKYGVIYAGIKAKCCFSTTGKAEEKVIPYALDFNVADYLIKSKDGEGTPFTVMAYSLSEKRTVILRYNNIFTKSDNVQLDDYKFSEADLWYHFAAFLVRVNKKIGADSITDNWEQEYCKSYCRCESFMHEIEGGQELLGRAFEPIRKAVISSDEKPSLNRQELEKNGVELFSEEEGRYRIRILNTFEDIYQGNRLMNFKSSESYRDLLHQACEHQDYSIGSCKIKQLFLEMIIGNKYSVDKLRELMRVNAPKNFQDILQLFLKEWENCKTADERNRLNEVTYTNSVLKRKSMIFRIKGVVTESVLDKIYEYFRGYNCIGFMNKEKNEINFEIEYERFNFRKIHEIALALRDIIEVIEPEEIAHVLQIRLKKSEKPFAL